jgi:hypothetical protein
MNSDNTNYEILPYSDSELEITPELEQKINKLLQFFDNTSIDYDQIEESLNADKKIAYPNYDSYIPIANERDITKWVKAFKNIRYLENNGANRVDSIRKVVSDWNVLEVFDFLNWMKFYSAGEHMKYKFAQLWYETGAPGYFLPIKPDQPQTPTVIKDIDFADTSVNNVLSEEKKSVIERQRNKIIARLDSAEKLLRSQDGNLFAGKEFETLIDAIYQLKKKIQLVNKVSLSTKLYNDMIVRSANILVRDGFSRAANVLYSVAQANNPPPDNTFIGTALPMPTPSGDPLQNQGSPGGLPTTAPGAPTTPPDYGNEMSPVSRFLDNLDTSNISDIDNLKVDDDSIEVEDNNLLVTEAQLTPAPVSNVDKPLEVVDKDQINLVHKDFDKKVNDAFSNITIADIVLKLEELAKVFKVREIPRQLSIIDIMLDSLGLASYFPSLAEATNKSLESNNYISSRVEDILSKLRGAMHTKDIDLQGDDSVQSPEVNEIKNKLQSNEQKEKLRKQLRKEQELDAITPEIEIEEDLQIPTEPVAANITAPAPTPVPAPVVPPVINQPTLPVK